MLEKLQNNDFVKYVLVSFFVTILDFSVTVFLSYVGVYYLVSNAIGNIVGGLVQYVLLAIVVFKVPLSLQNFLKYIGSFILGLILSSATMKLCVGFMKLNITTAKVMAIALPFAVNYVIRKLIVFTPARIK